MKERKGEFRTTDARGRSVSMLAPYRLHLLRRHDVIPKEPLARIASALGSGLTRPARIFLIIGFVCCVPGIITFSVHLVRMFQAGGIVWPLPKSLFLANLWVIPFVLWISAGYGRSRRVRQVMLQHRRCPHCGYDLRLLPVSPEDGATVCPECGYAWRLAEGAHGHRNEDT